tara:strand:- start:193 stop:360 length:168 start_codon:yes stop_codon:yes gene_type:complete
MVIFMEPRGLAGLVSVARNRQFRAELFLGLLQVAMRRFFILFVLRVKMDTRRLVA